METKTTQYLINERILAIKALEMFERLEANLKPGERINEKTRWAEKSYLINIERELMKRGENITLTRFTVHHFPKEL